MYLMNAAAAAAVAGGAHHVLLRHQQQQQQQLRMKLDARDGEFINTTLPGQNHCVARLSIRMNHDFSCCSLDGVQKSVKI